MKREKKHITQIIGSPSEITDNKNKREYDTGPSIVNLLHTINPDDSHLENLKTKYSQLLEWCNEVLTKLELRIMNPFDWKNIRGLMQEELSHIVICPIDENPTVEITIYINFLENRIVSIESPHTFIKDGDIYDWTMFWIHMTPKVKQIEGTLRQLSVLDTKLKKLNKKNNKKK